MASGCHDDQRQNDRTEEFGFLALHKCVDCFRGLETSVSRLYAHRNSIQGIYAGTLWERQRYAVYRISRQQDWLRWSPDQPESEML